MSDCRLQDWNTADRINRMARMNRQNRMEIADDELPSGGNPLATVAAIILIFCSCAIAVQLVLTFADVIDNMGVEKISTTPSRTAVILHEESRGER